MQHKRLMHARRLRVEPLEDRRMLATIVVNSLADNTDADGLITLREAILAANTDTIADAVEGVQMGSGADVIEFDVALFEGGAKTILLTQGELQVTSSLTINGPGAEWLTVDASGNDPTPEEDNGDGSRVLNVNDGNNGINSEFVLIGVCLTGGDAAGSGGAAVIFENALIKDVVISNSAGGWGGGLFLTGGNLNTTVVLVDSVIENNFATQDGGGLAAWHTDVEIRRSLFRGNFTSDDGGAMELWDGTIRIYDSSLIENVAIHTGGAIETENVTLIVEGSTIARNVAGTATSDGPSSAIYLFGTDLQIRSSTLANNLSYSFHAVPSGGAIYGRGIHIENSIVAGNLHFTDDSVLHRDIVLLGPFEVRNSLIGHNYSTGLTEAPIDSPDANGNLIGGPIYGAIDPLLGPLANNGGPTPTHALLPGSPALDMGDPTSMAGVGEVPEFDQRGAPWTRVYGGRIDMGAFEAQPNPLPGDYNFDGVVDAADQTVWRDTLGSMTDLRADGDGSGMVEGPDYDVWVAGFGSVLASEAVGAAASVELPPPLAPPPRTGEGDSLALAPPHEGEGDRTSRESVGRPVDVVVSNHDDLLLFTLGTPDEDDASGIVGRKRRDERPQEKPEVVDLALVEWSITEVE